MLVRGKHYSTGELLDIILDAEGEIVSVIPADPVKSPDRVVEAVSPALFDIQINGCLGIGFNSTTLTEDGVRIVVNKCRSHGIGRLLPTLITGSFEAITHGMKTIRVARERDPKLAKAVPGIHLEGPYLSGEDGPRGAHPREHIRDPDWDEFRRWQDAAGGLIRLVTLAPEKPGAIPFIEKLAKAGVVIALGHTAANATQIADAIRAGAKLSTHLGNGSHAMLPRHDNYIWEQLGADELWASVIADRYHLPASILKTIVRVKTPARTILTCDAGSLAGLPPGVYKEWGTELEMMPGGKIVVPGTPFLAGSGVFLDDCVRHMANAAGVTVKDAIEMACLRPAELLGLPAARLECGHGPIFQN